MKKALLALLVMLTVAVLAACSAVQVNERMFVQLMGIEEDNGLYELTLQVYSGGSESDFRVVKGSGRSFYEAADMIMRENGRELFFGHCGAVFANDPVIRDGEKLRTLAGERISVGCPVIYALNPSAEVDRRDENGELIGADRILAETKRFAQEGLYRQQTLRDVTAACRSGEVIFIPMSDKGISGGAAVNMSGETALLDITETAALNLMNGGSGIRISLLGGSAELDLKDKAVYFMQSENGGEYELSILADMTLTETGREKDLSVYIGAAENIISRSCEELCRRAIDEGFDRLIFEEETQPYSNGDITVSAKTEISLDK